METYDLFAHVSSLFPSDPFSHYSTPSKSDPFHKALRNIHSSVKNSPTYIVKWSNTCAQYANFWVNEGRNKNVELAQRNWKEAN